MIGAIIIRVRIYLSVNTSITVVIWKVHARFRKKCDVSYRFVPTWLLPVKSGLHIFAFLARDFAQSQRSRRSRNGLGSSGRASGIVHCGYSLVYNAVRRLVDYYLASTCNFSGGQLFLFSAVLLCFCAPGSLIGRWTVYSVTASAGT